MFDIFQKKQVEKLDLKKNTIVIVGGGPIGLWSGILLKLQNPLLKVVVFEKRDSYVREHVLIIRKDALDTCIDFIDPLQHKDFEELKQSITGKVPTNVLEQNLKDFAYKKEVLVIPNTEIQSIEDIVKKVKKDSILAIIGADGRKSAVRSQLMTTTGLSSKNWGFQHLIIPALFPHQMVPRDWAYRMLSNNKLSILMTGINPFISKTKKENFKSIDEKQNILKEHIFLNQVMIKYRVEDIGKPLDKGSYYKTLKLMKYPVTEVVGKQQPGSNITQMTAVFIVTDEVADQLKHFSPWNPGKFIDLQQIDSELKDSVDIWFNAKKQLINQKVIVDSERINYVPISVYTSTLFTEFKDDVVYALAGDSAFGVPYFRALNNGFECSSELCKQLGSLFTKKIDKDNNLHKNMKQYSEYMRDKVYSEYSKASSTTHKYQFQMWLVKANGSVPWQFIKWFDGDFKKELHQTFDPLHENKDEQQNNNKDNNLQQLDQKELEIQLQPIDYHEELVQIAELEKKQSSIEEQELLQTEKQLSDQYKEIQNDPEYMK